MRARSRTWRRSARSPCETAHFFFHFLPPPVCFLADETKNSRGPNTSTPSPHVCVNMATVNLPSPNVGKTLNMLLIPCSVVGRCDVRWAPVHLAVRSVCERVCEAATSVSVKQTHLAKLAAACMYLGRPQSRSMNTKRWRFLLIDSAEAG